MDDFFKKLDIAQMGSETTRAIAASEQRERIAIQQREDLKRLEKITDTQSKSIEHLVETIKEQGRTSSKLGRLSLFLSILAVLFACGAFIFSLLDFTGDSIWQKEQIGVLSEIQKLIEPEIPEE